MAKKTWVAQAKITDPDLTLVQAMARGNPQALETLYTRHAAGILSYLTSRLGERQLAEEILQDVMLAAWQSAPRFRGESQVRTWLLSIARYRAINAARKDRRAAAAVPLEDETLAAADNTEQSLEQISKRSEIKVALQALPAEQRETLELVFYHGLSGAEAAIVMGVAPGTVKSRLHRAKAALRAELPDEMKKERPDA